MSGSSKTKQLAIDTILFGLNDDIEVSNMRILEGDWYEWYL